MKKILFIDSDKHTLHHFYEDLIYNYKYEVNWVTDANYILDELKTHYDAIIMEIIMPIPEKIFNYTEIRKSDNGLSTGIVLFEKIRTIYPTIPILIYTYKNNIPTDLFSFYLRKPELTQTITEKLEQMIGINHINAFK